jgi:drug/metabolite transporter (DMT)-like permease
VFLKRKIYPFQWFAVLLIVIGITIVGFVNVSSGGGGSDGGKDQATVLIGDILIVLAQIATAIQMCVEEKLMAMYPHPALKVVGLEGTFGFIILSLLLIPMYFIRPGGHPFENAPDALVQVGNDFVIVIAMIGNALSIAFFNFFGISVTQQLSASHRMVLDSVRTLLVWIAGLALFGEQFLPGQLLGFFVLAIGTAMYNEIFKLPFFEYPAASMVAIQNRVRTSSDLSTSMTASLIKDECNNVSTSFHHN